MNRLIVAGYIIRVIQNIFAKNIKCKFKCILQHSRLAILSQIKRGNWDVIGNKVLKEEIAVKKTN